MAHNSIAILGAGIFAKKAHLPALEKLGEAAPELVAVYSRSEKSAEDFAKASVAPLKLAKEPAIYFDNAGPDSDLDALLARSDIHSVIVVLPILAQPAVILKALAAGKHVISEKPIAKDVKHGRELIQEYEEKYKPKGLVWRVAENFECEPAYLWAAKAIAEGKIGKVVLFNSKSISYVDKTNEWYNTPWRTVPEYQGGFILDGGVHTIAALRAMLPTPISHLSAFASLNREHLAPHDTIHVIAKSESYHGIVELSFAAPTASAASTQITITGTEGFIHFTKATDPAIPWGTKATLTGVDGKDEVFEHAMTGVYEELKSFYNAVNGTADGLGDPWGALADVAFIEAALNSEGTLVELKALVGRR